MSSFDKIRRHNSGSYSDKSIITLMPTLENKEHSMTIKGKLSSNFSEVDVGIQEKAEFLAEPENETIKEIMDTFGLPNTLNYRIVENAVKKLGGIKIQENVNLNRYISNFVLNNYLKENGYESTKQGSQTIWKQIDIGYNNNSSELIKRVIEGIC